MARSAPNTNDSGRTFATLAEAMAYVDEMDPPAFGTRWSAAGEQARRSDDGWVVRRAGTRRWAGHREG